MEWNTVHSDPREPCDVAHSEQRVLWRVQGRKQFRGQIITAAIYRHPLGRELRMFLGAEDENNLLHSELARVDLTQLEQKATAMREVLIETGWTQLPDDPNSVSKQPPADADVEH